MTCYELAITLDAAGAGTATTAYPLCGAIESIRLDAAGTVLTAGTAEFTFTRQNDGGTVLALTNASAPFQYQPRDAVHSTTGGTTAYATGVGPVRSEDGPPIDDYLVCTVAQGEASGSGTLFIYVDD